MYPPAFYNAMAKFNFCTCISFCKLMKNIIPVLVFRRVWSRNFPLMGEVLHHRGCGRCCKHKLYCSHESVWKMGMFQPSPCRQAFCLPVKDLCGTGKRDVDPVTTSGCMEWPWCIVQKDGRFRTTGWIQKAGTTTPADHLWTKDDQEHVKTLLTSLTLRFLSSFR